MQEKSGVLNYKQTDDCPTFFNLLLLIRSNSMRISISTHLDLALNQIEKLMKKLTKKVHLDKFNPSDIVDKILLNLSSITASFFFNDFLSV